MRSIQPIEQKLAAAAIAVLALVAPGRAHAQGALTFQTWDSALAIESITGPGDTASATGRVVAVSSMANNPALDGSAWAHEGKWWHVHLSHTAVRISVTAQNPANFAPGVIVWAIGPAAPFDGGTTSWAGETSTAGFGTPHSFNGFEALGSAGTLWMQQGEGGNAKETLGYANSGPAWSGPGGWGETIDTGAHDVRTGVGHAGAVGGSTSTGHAELLLSGVKPGYYLVYVGGTDPALAGGLFDLEVEGLAPTAPGLALPGLVVLALALGGVGLRNATRSGSGAA